MSIDGRAKSYGTIWSDWTIGELLGHGSGGKTAVYKLTRINHGFVEEDVLKVVNIIEENLGIDEMSEEYRNDYLAREREAIERAESEVNLMHRLRNCNNIITYQDFKFHLTREEHMAAVDLLIRMHKYTDLSSVVKRKSLSMQEIIKVGIDICTALEGCKKNGIVHRDIKPENIFYDGNQYILGDFGISRILENGLMAQTSKGTPPFAAPEQFDTLRPEEGYDFSVDVYSLGLTLYVLANKGKLPFMDMFSSVNNALMMRLSGNPIPEIRDIDEELNRIILKACEFKREDRYGSVTDMKEELQDFLRVLRKRARRELGAETKKELEISYATEPALGKAVSEISYATEPALGKAVSEISHATEPALGKAVSEISHATELALGKAVSEISYATEPALGKAVSEISYATEPALGKAVSEISYATETALGKEVSETSYATEPALGKAVSEMSYATEPIVGILSGKEPVLMQSDREVLRQDFEPPKGPLESVKEHRIVNKSTNEHVAEEVDYRAKAVEEMVKGNNENALAYFTKLIQQGDLNAMYYEIKNIYFDESVIKKDALQAIFWYEECVKCCKDSWTISLAEYQLGEIYAKGLGVKKNHKLAEQYFMSSASKGNPYAKKKFVAGKYIK